MSHLEIATRTMLLTVKYKAGHRPPTVSCLLGTIVTGQQSQGTLHAALYRRRRRLAVRVAEGFICTSGKDWELYTETLLPAVKEGAEKAGRDYDSIDKLIEMKVSYDTDRERALQETRLWAALALPAEAKVGVEDLREMQRMADKLPIEKVASRWIVSDDPDEQVAKIKPYIDLGFTHLVFHAPGLDQVRFIELYGRDVLPKLRALGE
jgi:coenzyme F420-dependent glucose-6-phosphate dehydrogenase